MTKLATLSVVAFSALLLGGCTKAAPTTQTTSQKTSEAAEFAAAIQSGRPTRCELSKGENTMTYYLEGKKLRADMNNVVGEGQTAKKMISHMVSDGATFYMWADGEKRGTKMAVPSEEETKQMAEDAKKYQTETSSVPTFSSENDYAALKDDGYTIDCKATGIDNSLFTPPSDVTFIDPTEMTRAIPSPDANGQIDMAKLQEMAKQYGAESTGE
jgi:hypothetical protein